LLIEKSTYIHYWTPPSWFHAVNRVSKPVRKVWSEPVSVSQMEYAHSLFVGAKNHRRIMIADQTPTLTVEQSAICRGAAALPQQVLPLTIYR